MQPSEITKLYKGVIEEVIKNVRNDFVNMGVDEQVLYDLQMLWEQKLLDYKVISSAEYFGNLPNNNNNLIMNSSNIPLNLNMNMNHPINLNLNQMQQMQMQLQHINSHLVGGDSGSNNLNVLASGAAVAVAASSSSGPQPEAYGGYIKQQPVNRTTYYHPSQGYFEASSTVTPPTAANLPNAAPYTTKTETVIAPNITQTSTDSTVNPTSRQITQKQNPRRYDGAGDDDDDDEEEVVKQSISNTKNNENNNLTSTSISNDPEDIIKLLYTNDETVVLESNNSNNLQGKMNNQTTTTTTTIPSETTTLTSSSPVELQGDDEINSDLDDEDDEDDKDVDAEGYDESGTLDENVVLCQYEKVSRTRNKWRCVFKSGIIHVNGADYVFSKANGEFEW